MSLTQRDALLSRVCGQVWPFAPLLDAVQLRPAARVLDIGGGEGGLLRELERRGHNGQRELIDTLKGTDAHALPFADASFDVVFMVRVLAHLEDPARALAEAQRVLAASGVLVVAAHGTGHLSGIFGATVGDFGFPLRAEPLYLTLPVVLKPADQVALAASYGLSIQPAGEIKTALQLSGWTWQKQERG